MVTFGWADRFWGGSVGFSVGASVGRSVGSSVGFSVGFSVGSVGFGLSGSVTTTRQLAVYFLSAVVTPILALPALTPFTFPFLSTVAILSSLEAQ